MAVNVLIASVSDIYQPTLYNIAEEGISHVWKVCFLISCQPGSVALTDGSVHGSATLR